jgi:RNA polymerase sigma-70 factor (ECF subfamily)
VRGGSVSAGSCSGARLAAGATSDSTVSVVDELTRLLIAARDGSAAALAAFVRRTQPEIWRFSLHRVGRSHADDATQETYVEAWKALPQFRGESSARTWLFVIARRTTDRLARRHRRWRELADIAPRPSLSAHAESSVEVEGMLSALSPDKRLAIVLTQLIGLTYAEAAAVCDCPVGTIRSRVARAREDLIVLTRADEDASRPATS